MPLVYVDGQQQFFWYAHHPQERAPHLTPLIGEANSARVELPGAGKRKRRTIQGLRYPLLAIFWHLVHTKSAATVASFDDSLRLWHSCCHFVLNLLARGRVLPGLVRQLDATDLEGRWRAALGDAADAAFLGRLAKAAPVAVLDLGAQKTPYKTTESHDVHAIKILHCFCDDAMDLLVREMLAGAAVPGVEMLLKGARPSASTASWEVKWHQALHGKDATLVTTGGQAQKILRLVQSWTLPQAGQAGEWFVCLRVSAPVRAGAPFTGCLSLRSPVDPAVHLPLGQKAKDILAAQNPYLWSDALDETMRPASEIFAPLRGRKDSKPFDLAADDVHLLLQSRALMLRQLGFIVLLPPELSQLDATALQLRLQIGVEQTPSGLSPAGGQGLRLEDVVQCSWQALLGDQPLTVNDLDALVAQATPLVEHCGRWLTIDQEALASICKRLRQAPAAMTVHQGIRAVLSGEVQDGNMSVAAIATGAVAAAIERHRQQIDKNLPAPAGLCAVLRPYQRRGLAWLHAMSQVGLGACLADDMGLGKTVQMLAFLLQQQQQDPQNLRASLLVAPTSVLSNWAKEAATFAPTLAIRQHYGFARSNDPNVVGQADGALVLTSYGTLRQDSAVLAKIPWRVVVLDEAQYIKNANSGTARAARNLTALHRFALTGTPLENRLAELWSILDFANPGLMGSQAYFKRIFSLPIEKKREPKAIARLRRMIRPFLLRRLKTDPAVAQDLPPKLEMDVFCRLTQEQAVLYRAAVAQHLDAIASASGLARRGRIFALLTQLKQICNHPAHFLGKTGPLPKRSGKLLRLTELLAEVLAEDDKALIFTQYKEMGTLLVKHIRQNLGVEPIFLHGGTPRSQRDAYVEAFQQDDSKPGVFVLSLKAGGTGLNLSAASHVFHYDRWWNPAVEDQATDRAHRIGQRRCVQVHKMICSGTIEEKLDAILKQKRALSKMFVSSSEDWVTDLDDQGLRELFSLSAQATGWTENDDQEQEHELSA